MTINDLPVGRSVDETLRLVKAFQITDKLGEGEYLRENNVYTGLMHVLAFTLELDKVQFESAAFNSYLMNLRKYALKLCLRTVVSFTLAVDKHW